MNKKLAVVLVSGGMDSCVTAAIANERYGMDFLHISYGQRTERRELKAFEDIANFYKVEKRMVARLDHLREIGGSSLTDERIEVSQANLKRGGVPTSYVPFRNAHFLSIGVSWAEVIGAGKIFIGASEADGPGYPDCRKGYYEIFNKLVDLGTKPETKLEIVTPLIGLRKSEIIRKGIELGAPLELTWSCYKNEAIPCGECDSCALRKRGFQEVGVEDPIIILKKN